MHGATLPAGALFTARIELFEERRQIIDNAAQLHFHAMQQRVAFETEPFEPIDQPVGTLALDHHADAAGNRALRRMAEMRRQEEDLALADRDLARSALLHHAQDHVALELVEEFL